MANSTAIRTILALMLFLSLFSLAPAGHQDGWFPTPCWGTVGDCMVGQEEEFDMDSESNRRVLAARRYISYGALRRNSIPCSRRGASYYNCRRGAQANPYSRGCSAITRCRR